MSDKVAMMLARVTAGCPVKDEGPPSTTSNVNLVMGAMGMGKAGRFGSLVLLANYCDDEAARRWAEGWLARWAWVTWFKVGQGEFTVTTRQITDLAKLALTHHINPALARQTSIKKAAKLIRVNHQTYRLKYLKHYQRIRAEIAYHESQAIAALMKHL